MNPEAGTTWTQVSGLVVLALVLFLLPGWVLARALGFPRLDRLGMSGPLGVALFLAAGAAADLGGFSWTPAVGVLFLIGTTVLAAVLARLLRGTVQVDGPNLSRGSWIGLAAGIAAAGAGTAWKLMSGIGRPDRISQEVDAPFHLQAVALLVDKGSASPFQSGDVHFYGPSFYPGGLHSLAATLAGWTDANVVVSTHIVLLVCAAVIFPLGLTVLVARAVSVTGWVLASAGLLALTAVYAPIALLSLGGAWANLVSACLVPGALVPLALHLASETPPKPREAATAAAAMAIATAAAVLAQPSAVYTVSLLAAALAGPVMVRWGRRWTGVFILGAATLVVAWVGGVNEVMINVPINADPSTRRAILVLLKNGQVPLWSGALVAGLTVAGVFLGLRRRRLSAGIAVAWLTTAAVAASLQFAATLPVQHLTWPWFSAYGRIVTMVTVAVVLVACVAVAAAVRWGERRSATVAASIGALMVTGLAVAAVPAVAEGKRLVRASYDPQPRLSLVSEREVVELHELADVLDVSDTVALDPFRGGVFLALFGPRVVPVGPYYGWTPDIEVVSTRLDRVTADPDVCMAVRRLGVTHVLVGGGRMEPYTDAPTYPGIDRVPKAFGFELVASEGDYDLYILPRSCAS